MAGFNAILCEAKNSHHIFKRQFLKGKAIVASDISTFPQTFRGALSFSSGILRPTLISASPSNFSFSKAAPSFD